MTKEIYLKKDNMYAKFYTVNGTPRCTSIYDYGCTFEEKTFDFSSREQGNAFYKLIMDKDSWVRIDREEYERVVRGY